MKQSEEIMNEEKKAGNYAFLMFSMCGFAIWM